MKNKIQRYLAGEREGFSLVELIIVIAIMAILVGVVALAVLPNIAKSRESKDISALDSILSALNSAVASEQVSKSGGFAVTINADGEADFAGTVTAVTGDNGDYAKVATAVSKLLGNSGKVTFGSTKAAVKDQVVQCKWDPTTRNVSVRICAAKDDTKPVESEHNGATGFEVTN